MTEIEDKLKLVKQAALSITDHFDSVIMISTKGSSRFVHMDGNWYATCSAVKESSIELDAKLEPPRRRKNHD